MAEWAYPHEVEIQEREKDESLVWRFFGRKMAFFKWKLISRKTNFHCSTVCMLEEIYTWQNFSAERTHCSCQIYAFLFYAVETESSAEWFQTTPMSLPLQLNKQNGTKAVIEESWCNATGFHPCNNEVRAYLRVSVCPSISKNGPVMNYVG